MEWGQPQNFLWLLAVPAVAAVFWLSSFRRKLEMKRFGEVALVERLMSSFNPSKRLAKRALFLAALTCMVLALCQPHLREKETLVERKGIDVIIAIDVSNSMLAKDISPSRLEKAKLELSGLIDQLKGNRIGIIAFAGEAMIQCPLTLDTGAAKLFLSTIHPNLIPVQGTSLSSAINVALRAFSDKEKDHKALILLTDGEDHEPGAIESAKRARDTGMRVFTVGIGTSDGSTLPAEFNQGFKKDMRGQVVLSKLNEALLKEIARITDGVYFRSSRGDLEADKIAGQIRGMSQKGLKKEWSVEYEENYQLFVAAATILLLIEMALSERRRVIQ